MSFSPAFLRQRTIAEGKSGCLQHGKDYAQSASPLGGAARPERLFNSSLAAHFIFNGSSFDIDLDSEDGGSTFIAPGILSTGDVAVESPGTCYDSTSPNWKDKISPTEISVPRSTGITLTSIEMTVDLGKSTLRRSCLHRCPHCGTSCRGPRDRPPGKLVQKITEMTLTSTDHLQIDRFRKLLETVRHQSPVSPDANKN